MVRLLLVGTGNMAANHARQFGAIEGCEIVACVDVLASRAEAFAIEHGISKHFDALDKALAWGELDAAVNVTPDGAHFATTMPLLEAGKHVLCEKPLAPDYASAAQMRDAAEARGVVNMVNFTYRNAAALQEARRRVLAGEIGDVRHVEASYRQSWLVSDAWGRWRDDPAWLWRLSKAHGSTGALGDVGVHIIDFTSFGSGLDVEHVVAELPVYAKAAGDRIGEYPLDANDSALLIARLATGARASIVASRYATGHINELALSIHGTHGAFRVTTDGRTSALEACLGDDVHPATWRALECPAVPSIAERFVAAIQAGPNGQSGEPSFARAAQVQRVIDAAVESDREGRGVSTVGRGGNCGSGP